MRLMDVNVRRWFGLKYKLVCHFKLAVDMVGGGIRRVCVLRGQTNIPEKIADGIWSDWIPIGQSS